MTKANSLPDLDTLKSLFRYDKKTGKLFWKRRPRHMFKNEQAYGAWNTKYAGQEAGTLHRGGYIKVGLLGTMTMAHRVCFSLAYGRELSEQEVIDHKNRDTVDNKKKNMRIATRSQNMWNQARRLDRINNLPKGVTIYKPTGRYCAYFQANYKKIYLGYFATPEEATAALIVARKLHHGAFARHSAD